MKARSHPGHTLYGYRVDPLVPAFPDDRPIIIFDGNCVLCSRFARFVLRHDQGGALRLIAGQTPIGQALYRHFNLDPVRFETNVLLEDGRAWFKSAGTIRMFAYLGLPWTLCFVLKIFPRKFLDLLYDLIAHNRLRWFGSEPVCFLADDAHRDRFIT